MSKAAAFFGAGGPEVFRLSGGAGGRPSAPRTPNAGRASAHHLVMGFADGDWRYQCDLVAEATALLT